LFPESWRAVTEAVRAEEDERLGRWRWPENQNYVVYPAAHDPNGDLPGGVNVVVDGSGDMDFYSLSGDFQIPEKGHVTTGEAARAYFDAHPEPKPWHSAQPGEVWVLTTENVGDEVAARVANVNERVIFEYVRGLANVGITDPRIVTARRIWPEVD
jgi:hypothetical protein